MRIYESWIPENSPLAVSLAEARKRKNLSVPMTPRSAICSFHILFIVSLKALAYFWCPPMPCCSWFACLFVKRRCRSAWGGRQRNNPGWIIPLEMGKVRGLQEYSVPKPSKDFWFCGIVQVVTAIVFVNRFISITCTLNGRKVIAWILWRVRNGKI